MKDYQVAVSNLGSDVDEALLQAVLSKFGRINMAEILRDQVTGKSRGCGFVHFEKANDAAAAVDGMHGDM